MSVIGVSASARQQLLSRTGKSDPDHTDIDEDIACLQAIAVRWRMAASAQALTGDACEDVLHLMT
ncbi:hypothetical protein ACQR1I_16270 [Bradyrhizobium sp. HKCCYLS2038]|uniref:hypothetical protein n=1 Tax=unclassified Bradyrhizobium TaxID=2631580 RepID=UPI003EBF4EF0